jgi:hypothetical protein
MHSKDSLEFIVPLSLNRCMRKIHACHQKWTLMPWKKSRTEARLYGCNYVQCQFRMRRLPTLRLLPGVHLDAVTLDGTITNIHEFRTRVKAAIHWNRPVVVLHYAAVLIITAVIIFWFHLDLRDGLALLIACVMIGVAVLLVWLNLEDQRVTLLYTLKDAFSDPTFGE